ncbi:Putative protein in type-1 retrotransposable element R1DM [Araneus ventricosus]|uniref:Reverse transcriptase domain-containing protein n=1 Tax=Araneus ventricosus TaxID=182803 RepID=A0A4Y2IVD5_ARAVE|nr:Putative protein in type-1 retrotransposable element R1DM [Araneus ventricosus]
MKTMIDLFEFFYFAQGVEKCCRVGCDIQILLKSEVQSFEGILTYRSEASTTQIRISNIKEINSQFSGVTRIKRAGHTSWVPLTEDGSNTVRAGESASSSSASEEPSAIDYIVLKEVNNSFPEILHTFYNKCYQLHCFPEPLKKGIIVLFHKDGKEADKIKSYRPVTLLPTIGKVLEQILLRRLNHTLKKKNILHHNQFGFREGRSTDDAIHQLTEKIQDAKNKQLHTMVISLDIQGAFDHLQYNSIRNSLDEINFPSHTIETLKDILTDRKVTIQTAQGPVSWSQQQGCAQGSCTGPMFWNLVANEIISEEWQPNVHLQAFADDFIFVISEPTGAKLKATAQAALTKFQHWTDKHQLKVSTEKSTTILISRLVSGPRVKWDNQIIKRWEVLLKYSTLALKKESYTRWSSHREAVTVVLKNLDKIVDALNHLALDAVSRPQTKFGAVSLLKSIQTFEFIAFTCFWQKALKKLDIVSKMLQKEDIAIYVA